jgi:hypothetical protein
MSFADKRTTEISVHPWFETESAPIFGFRFPRQMENAELEAYCEWFSGWYARQPTPIGMICDMSQSLVISAQQRQIWTRFEQRSALNLRRVLRGVAIVVTTNAIRGVVTATYWMNPPVYEYEVVATRQQAYDWLKTRLP